MRLTEKSKLEQARLSIKVNGADLVNDSTLIYAKLGQLEDIEEELGIDLVTLIKALKNGIYVKNTGVGNTNWNKDIITKVKVPCLKLDSDTGKTLRFEQKRRYWVDTYELKDYGKTWALTKEELL